MQAAITRQDMQSVLEDAKNRIMARIVTRQDVLVSVETLRNRLATQMNDIHQQDLQLSRRLVFQANQTHRRALTIEARLSMIENELKNITNTLGKLENLQSQQPRWTGVVASNAPTPATNPVFATNG